MCKIRVAPDSKTFASGADGTRDLASLGSMRIRIEAGRRIVI